MTVLSAREAYRLWAPSYGEETAISFLERDLAAKLTPPLEGRRLLDAGCGTGRRLHGTGAALAVGVDLCPEMLAAGDAERDPAIETRVGDVRCLPASAAMFDVVWCRLVIGHLPDCAPAYAELARVAAAGARLVVTDFHPKAHAAGHRRTFRCDDGVREIEHYVHDLGCHLNAAEAAGWRPASVREAAIGPAVLPFYETAGRLAAYREHEGLPVVLGLAFDRDR